MEFLLNSNITDSDLTQARKNWGDALVSISTAFEDQGVDAAIEIAGNIGPYPTKIVHIDAYARCYFDLHHCKDGQNWIVAVNWDDGN